MENLHSLKKCSKAPNNEVSLQTCISSLQTIIDNFNKTEDPQKIDGLTNLSKMLKSLADKEYQANMLNYTLAQISNNQI